MKLTLITSATSRAQAWAAALTQADRSFDVRSVIKPLHEVSFLINGNVPDVAVLDMSDQRSMGALAGFVRSHPLVHCVLVGDDLSAEALEHAQRIGLRGVQLATCDAREVVSAVQRLGTHPAVEGQVITFTGCKGGSGATFTAANLACLLAAGGRRRVALLDLNLQLGDAHLFISNQRPPSDVEALARNMHRLDEELLVSAMLQVSPNLHVLAAAEALGLDVQVQPVHVQRIIECARRVFDLVLIDTGRVLDGVNLQALDAADRICVVLQMALPSIRDAKRLQRVFEQLGYPAHRAHWIVNRCQSGGPITLEDVRRVLGVSDLMTLPNQYDVVARSVNQGIPVTTLAPHSRITRALHKVAAQMDVAAADAVPQARWLANFWRNSAQH